MRLFIILGGGKDVAFIFIHIFAVLIWSIGSSDLAICDKINVFVTMFVSSASERASARHESIDFAAGNYYGRNICKILQID